MLQISVTIIYRSQGEKCKAACGLDWSSAETVSVMNQRVNERFGTSVKLTVVDLSLKNSVSLRFNQYVQKKNLSLPLLLVNEEVRISGEFDARQLMDAIEVEKELKWKPNLT